MNPARRSRIHLFAGLIAGIAVITPALAPSSVSAQPCNSSDPICRQIGQAQAQQAANQRRLSQIEAGISDAEAKMGALQNLIGQIDSQISAQQGAIAKTKTDIAVLNRRIAETQAAIVREDAAIKVKQAQFDHMVRLMDSAQLQSGAWLNVLFSSRSFTDLLDRALMIRQVIDSNHRLMDGLKAAKARLADERRSLSQQQARERAALSLEQGQEAQLEKSRADRRAAYQAVQAIAGQLRQEQQAVLAQQAQVQGQIQALQQKYQQELAAIAAQQAAAAAAAAAAARSGGGGAPPPPQPSRFGWPESSRYPVVQPFGCTGFWAEPPYGSCAHFHTGIDIAGPGGISVLASAAGVAQDYSSGYGYGNYVLVLHPGGWATLYGHLAAFAVSSGQLVGRGQVIGYEGASGNATGPHLHFEIRLDGQYQDPCAYVC